MDDLIVVGAGWAGLAAAGFAVERGAKVRLIAQGIGSPIVTPGWISVYDSPEKPLAAVRAAITACPDHPYALAGLEALENGTTAFCRLSEKIGLPYRGGLESPHRQPLALGTMAYPAFVPPGYAGASQVSGGEVLFVGFAGWRDYDPALSGAHHALIDLPDGAHVWDAPPTELARAFDREAYRVQVAGAVQKHLKNMPVQAVAFPAVLGLEAPGEVVADLAARIGLPVFELPTLPPSVPGTRLFNRMRRYLLDNRARVQIGHPVVRGLIENGRAAGVEVAAVGKPETFRAKAVILATGGLYGGGLFSDDRGRLWEPIFGLSVDYPPDRAGWFGGTLFDPAGHAIHHVGIKVDGHMRPLNAAGEPLAGGLFAAGHILRHPEGGPSPLVTAEGVALATAYKAVQSALG